MVHDGSQQAVTHCLVLTSRNIQLPSPLDWGYSQSWDRFFSLKTLLGQELGSNLLSFHVFLCLQLSPQGFHPLPVYTSSVKETAGTGITPDSGLSLKNLGGGGWMKEYLSSLSIQETFRSMDLIILLAIGHHRQLTKAMDTL